MVLKELICPSGDERSRNQTYFVLFRPHRPEPHASDSSWPSEEEEATEKDQSQDQSQNQDQEPSPPKKKQKKARGPRDTPVEEEQPLDEAPAVIHIPAPTAAPSCGTSDAVRDRVMHCISDLFSAGGEGVTTLSSLGQAMRGAGVGEEEVPDAQVKEVLEYLSDLNRIMIDDSGGGDIDIYQI